MPIVRVRSDVVLCKSYFRQDFHFCWFCNHIDSFGTLHIIRFAILSGCTESWTFILSVAQRAVMRFDLSQHCVIAVIPSVGKNLYVHAVFFVFF